MAPKSQSESQRKMVLFLRSHADRCADCGVFQQVIQRIDRLLNLGKLSPGLFQIGAACKRLGSGLLSFWRTEQRAFRASSSVGSITTLFPVCHDDQH